MDLHLTTAAASDEERDAVDALLGAPDSGWHGAGRDEATFRYARGGRAARDERHLLLPALHALQGRVGWISEGGLNYVSERLSVPPAEAYGVATFYALFSVQPRAKTVIHVCDDLACRIAGAEDLCARVESALGPAGSAQGERTWVRSPCLGQCERAPAILVQRAGADGEDEALAPVDGAAVDAVAAGATPAGADEIRVPQVESGRDALRLLRRVGLVDPESFEDYHAHGGFASLRRAVELGAEATIREVADSKLMGRGGAAFPTGVKWKAVAEQPVHPHYFICNADESEPGTFKDRILMERDPYALIEALTIAGFATGSERGYVYIRGEYPLATRRLRHAIEECRHRGYLGADVMGEGFAFDIELRRGAGAYICGEETALFNSLEGKRGEPRNKPPFPVQRGLFGKPTGINNVETLLNVLEILRIGGAGLRADRHRGLHRTAAVLPVGPRRAPGPVRGRLRRHAARGPRTGGRGDRRAEGDPAGRGCRRVRHARGPGHPAHVRGLARGRLHVGVGRRHGAEPRTWTSSTSCCGSPGSSATSPAGSACRAGWAPSARRNCCSAWSAGARSGPWATSWRCSTTSPP